MKELDVTLRESVATRIDELASEMGVSQEEVAVAVLEWALHTRKDDRKDDSKDDRDAKV